MKKTLKNLGFLRFFKSLEASNTLKNLGIPRLPKPGMGNTRYFEIPGIIPGFFQKPGIDGSLRGGSCQRLCKSLPPDPKICPLPPDPEKNKDDKPKVKGPYFFALKGGT